MWILRVNMTDRTYRLEEVPATFKDHRRQGGSPDSPCPPDRYLGSIAHATFLIQRGIEVNRMLEHLYRGVQMVDVTHEVRKGNGSSNPATVHQHRRANTSGPEVESEVSSNRRTYGAQSISSLR